jgi:hypothetical protein
MSRELSELSMQIVLDTLEEACLEDLKEIREAVEAKIREREAEGGA